MNGQDNQLLDFELPNVGRGSETVQAGNLVADSDYLLVVLLGSHYCSRSRELVRALCECHDAFRRRETTVVAVLPDIRERARVWDRQYDLPFPMVADPAETTSDDERTDDEASSVGADETDAFGTFEPLGEAVGSRPAVALCRPGDGGLTVVATDTEATLDVPVVESLLRFVDRHRATDASAAGNAAVDG